MKSPGILSQKACGNPVLSTCHGGLLAAQSKPAEQPTRSNGRPLITAVLSQSRKKGQKEGDTRSGGQPVMRPHSAQSQSWLHKWVSTVLVIIIILKHSCIALIPWENRSSQRFTILKRRTKSHTVHKKPYTHPAVSGEHIKRHHDTLYR